MTFEAFCQTLTNPEPPDIQECLLRALWYDGKEDWESAHLLAQDVHSAEGSWVHAYLHRKEGDLWNARYWYEKANKPVPTFSLREEWETLVRHVLNG